MPAGNPTGKALLRASLALFRQDQRMIWLPVMATISALVAYAVVAVPIALALGHKGLAILVALFCGSVAANAATVIFNVALVFAATDRIEGRTPTVRGALAQAWGRKHVIFRWALLSAVVGTAIRSVESRLGAAGRILGLLGGLAWAVATYLAVPVLAFENVGPIDAVKRSSHVLRTRFGTIARSALRFGFLFTGLLIGGMVVLFIGIALAASPNGAVVGVPIAVLGFALLIGVSMYANAAGMYMRTILYRFATDQSIPDLGINVADAFGGSRGYVTPYGGQTSMAGAATWSSGPQQAPAPDPGVAPLPSFYGGSPQPIRTPPGPSTPPPARVPAGWYHDGTGERWWDGVGWSEYTR